jgi:YihY family inner membrane protein
MPSILPSRNLPSADSDQAVKPLEEVRPVVPEAGFRAQIVALAHYMARTEVHTYAFSVAANAILSLFPFIVLLLTICRRVFHSGSMEAVVGDMMKNFLPVGQDFVMRNMQLLAHPRKGVQVFSLVMLLVSSTGIFMPLEVALNRVWGFRSNRSYLMNQLISLGLAFACGSLTLVSIGLTAGNVHVLKSVLHGYANWYVQWAGFLTMKMFSIISGIAIFFLIYWLLPNGKVRPKSVLPAAVIMGLLSEALKYVYIFALPFLNFSEVYGPFAISVGLMFWAFLSGMLLLTGAHLSARKTLRNL